MNQHPRISGRFQLVCLDYKRRLRWKANLRNGTTYEGVNTVLNAGFSGSVSGPWYGGLIAGGSPVTSINDTFASHAGWSEYTAVTAAVRPTANFGTASGAQLATFTSMSFTMSSGGSLRGIFLCNQPSFSAVAGVIYSTCLAASNLTVFAGDVIFASYILRMRN